MSFTGDFEQALNMFFEIWGRFWWVFLPLFLGVVFFEFWLFYLRTMHINKLKWTMLRVKTPKDILKSPEAMEHIFSAASSIYSHGLKFWEVYWEGQIEDWTSFELVGYHTGISFYIRCLEKHRSMYEAAVYAQYPDAEIEVVEDYTTLLPSVLPNKTYELFGADMVLAANDAYPLRTYKYWEEAEIVRPNNNAKGIDTMAPLLEVMSKLKEGEIIWLQVLIRMNEATYDNWRKGAEKLRDKLAGRKDAKKTGWGGDMSEFFSNLLKAPFGDIEWSEAKKEEAVKPSIMSLTAGEQETIKGIEEKIAKIIFETDIRWLYIAKKGVFARGTASGIIGSFRQFSNLNMNGLRMYKPTLGIARQPFKAQKIYYKKRMLYDYYRLRRYPPHGKFSVMNIEELASVYHYPSQIVEAPMLRRVEAKKGEAPPSLPIE